MEIEFFKFYLSIRGEYRLAMIIHDRHKNWEIHIFRKNIVTKNLGGKAREIADNGDQEIVCVRTEDRTSCFAEALNRLKEWTSGYEDSNIERLER